MTYLGNGISGIVDTIAAIESKARLYETRKHEIGQDQTATSICEYYTKQQYYKDETKDQTIVANYKCHSTR